MVPLVRLLLLALLLAPALARAEVCSFDRTTACVSATMCTAPPSGCTLSADDYWDIGGGGESELQRIEFPGAPTGGSFTLTWNGETTAPIPYEDNALCTDLGTPFACCNKDKSGHCSLAHNVKSALEALDSVAPGDVALAYDCTYEGCNLTWIGSQVCTDVEQPVCAGSLTGGTSAECSVWTPQPGIPPATPVTVFLNGTVTQNAAFGAGMRVRCGSSLRVQAIHGRTITLGPRGLIFDYGSSSTFLGGIRAGGAAAPMSHLAPWTPADGLWRASAIWNCPDGACDTNVRRILAPTASDAAPGDVVYFPLGGNSMDEGFWYDVSAAYDAGGLSAIDIDPAQSQTESVGWTLARKGITRAMASAASPAGDRVIRIQDGVIAYEDQFVGFCLYVGGYPHVIKRTLATTDTLTLLRDEGLVRPVAAGDTVFLSSSCHRAGDDFYVASPIRLRSATGGTRRGDQEDGFIRVRGATDWDWVVVDWAWGMTFEGITGTIDHLWIKDRGQNASAARFDNMYGRSLGSFQVTGGPDLDGPTLYANCDAGDDSDCGQHGIGFSGSVGNSVAGWFERHGGDDCLWSWDQVGRPSANHIEVFRCQHRLGAVSSMECMSSLVDDGLSIGVGECINATGRGAGGRPGPGSGEVLTLGPGGGAPAEIGSLFALYAESVASHASIRLRNLWATRIDLRRSSTNSTSVFFNSCSGTGACASDPAARNVLFSDVTNFLIDDWSSVGSATLNANGGCIRARNGIIKGGVWTEQANDNAHDRLVQLSKCEDGPVWVENVGWIDANVVDRSLPGRISLLYTGISEFENLAPPGSYARNLLFYWTNASPFFEPDVGFWDGGGTVAADSLKTGGLAFVRFNGNAPLGGTIALNPTSAANVFAGEAPLCFAGTPPVGHVSPEIAPLLPPGSLESAPPTYPDHSYVLPPDHPWSQAGCGLTGSPGVCTRQRWHQWEDVSVRQTCYGEILEP